MNILSPTVVFSFFFLLRIDEKDFMLCFRMMNISTSIHFKVKWWKKSIDDVQENEFFSLPDINHRAQEKT